MLMQALRTETGCIAEVEQWECAELMGRGDRRRRMQVGLIEFGEILDAEQPEADANFLFKEFQYAVDTGFAGCGHAVKIKAADRHGIGAACHALDHIGAATKPAVDDDLCAAANGAHHLLQDIDRPAPMIKLTPTMVAHVNGLDTVVTSHDRIFGRRNALEDERQLAALPAPFDLTPGEPRLKSHRVRIRS